MTILSVTEIKENLEVDRLNNLIYQYNNLDIHKVRNEDKLIMLQRIDALSRKIFTDYIASKPNDDSNQFYNWFKSEPLLSELNTLCKDNINLSNQRLFELYSPVINSGGFVPLYNAFQQVEIANKKGQIDLKSLKNQLDLLVIHGRNLQKNPNDNTFINNYYKHLHLLQDKIISARNSIDPQPKEVKELCKQLDQMLQAVNSEAALFVTKNNLQNEKYLKRFKYPIKEITNWLCQGNQEALIKLLNETSDSKGKIEFQTLDGFDFKGLGGENNKNWRVTDSISGATFTVRLEKFDKMPYKGMEREVLYYKGNKHLEDNFETITLGKHKPENSNVKKSNEYVLAIGEFCSLGDILNAVRNMNGNDPEKK
ncbi:hypothetical protein [Legionella sainthelensi]|uniref:hypothetical protein n=1 Tax=Legionella sainthelensi TaxID=28087 RepID=UPI000E20AA61|nr:hypothetical protein [Legionella sainthelensi]